MTEFAQVRYDYKVASVAFEVSLIRLQRERIQMVLLRERGITQPEIADVTGVSCLSTVNRAHMAYDHSVRAALEPKPSGGRIRGNMTVAEEKALLQGRPN
jgi:hypothetical protein